MSETQEASSFPTPPLGVLGGTTGQRSFGVDCDLLACAWLGKRSTVRGVGPHQHPRRSGQACACPCAGQGDGLDKGGGDPAAGSSPRTEES